MTFAYYADDFTGAVDSMLQFRRAGLAGVLSTGIDGLPEMRDGADSGETVPDVIGIAGIARSLPTERLEAEVGPALALLAATGARVVQYKACSTADSSAERGSLGRVCEIAIERFGPQQIPTVFAQPGFGRFTFFGHHFAAEAGEVFRLDRQPTMRSHPATPITESELALHLGAQTALPVATLSWLELEAAIGSGDDAAVTRSLSGEGSGIVVCDALNDAHLEALGRAILAGARAASPGPRFVLGSGGLSLGIGRALGGDAPELPTRAPAADGPCLVLSGSRSMQTWAQINAAVAAGWRCVDLRRPGAVAETVALHAAGHHTILQTTDPSGGSMREADIVSGMVAAGRECLRQRPETRLVLCGGDTCGAILRELGVRSLTLSAAPWGNVVLCEGVGQQGRIEVVLKGGQMGQNGLFEEVRLGEGRAPAHNMEKRTTL
ncbi:four-carbon acid sugar kinase family protein [Leucobacter sp. wl10]|uniref:four-carbon acid sugar kinase family protein n=1 Tax=Leucobacter sp. wl10 TaxID=2304677 RepID=UPI000E5BACA1|nr:four-carbon acid sugar kinase family protein [Leucobacter sp. wl10]RGE18562.1 four-carbon acid sugar kinase family protein [Leucobacter sp. wl10]